ISDVVERALAFARAFYDERDKWRRYERLVYNAGLSGIGHRKLVRGRPGGGSFQMGQQGDAMVLAFPRPRLLTRGDLEDLQSQAQAVLTMFRRQLD
ncbi:MAG: hypothetical protein MI867_00115, partial [Pseudomonadales bacterium]|nr:hypothetical protein [Pseudomonadales bacterium]